MTDRAFRRPESVLVLVHTRGGEVLLLERVEPRGFWQSVTGSLEVDETPVQAARRELLEETGLDLDVVDEARQSRFEIKPPWRARFAPGVTHNLEHHFSVCVETRVEVRLDPDEHVDCRWLDAASAIDLASSWTNRDAIRQVVLGEPVTDRAATAER